MTTSATSRVDPAAAEPSRRRRAGPRSGAAPSRTRGLTLFELLLVVGLLVAIGALALPVTLDALSRRRFESAVDGLMGQLLLARSHARANASAVEVVLLQTYDGAEPATRVEVRTLDLLADAGASSQAATFLGDEGLADDRAAIAESWASRTYPVSIEPARHDADEGTVEPEELDALAEQARRVELVDRRAGLDAPVATRVAIFVADGGAPLAPRLLLKDGEGRAATVVVNPWTGRPALEASSSSPAEGSGP